MDLVGRPGNRVSRGENGKLDLRAAINDADHITKGY